MHNTITKAVSAGGLAVALTLLAGPISPAAAATPTVSADSFQTVKSEKVAQKADAKIQKKAQKFSYKNATAQDTEALIKYYVVSAGDRSESFFDIEAAVQDGASSDLLDLGQFYNSFAASYRQGDSGFSTRAWPGVHGLYCGPNRTGPGTPETTLDRLCMEHDNCYAQRGYFDSVCDQYLVASIYDNLHRMYWGERAKALAIAAFFGG